MALQIQGNGGAISEVDGTIFRALRVNTRPLDYGTLGHYRVATVVALVATQAANGTLFSFRWADATRFCAIQHIRLEVLQTAAATATIMPNFEVVVARSFSASDSGGTQVVTTGNNMKKRTSMGTSLVTDIRKSTLAAGLTVGTRTLDADPIFHVPYNMTITTPNANSNEKELDWTSASSHPLILATNEGFIVRGPSVVFGAAGTANLVVDVSWAELASY